MHGHARDLVRHQSVRCGPPVDASTGRRIKPDLEDCSQCSLRVLCGCCRSCLCVQLKTSRHQTGLCRSALSCPFPLVFATGISSRDETGKFPGTELPGIPKFYDGIPGNIGKCLKLFKNG